MCWGNLVIIAALALAGCSKAGGPNVVAKEEVAESPAQSPPAGEQIAYTYFFGFKLPAGRIAAVQAQHVALCDRLGSRCHVVSMEQTGDTRSAGASMELAVDARAARSFGNALVKGVERERGDVVDRSIRGENLTRQIVDVEARLRGRQALADRLLVVVKTHQGSVADLVAAQKALADVQQDIDTARSELVAARGRVAMSTLQISYLASVGLGGLTVPIGDSFASFGSIIGTSVGPLLTLVAALLPWLALIGLLALAVRWWKRRHRMEE